MGVKGKRAGEPAKGRQKGPKEKPAEEVKEKQQAKAPKPAPVELSAAERSDIFFQQRKRFIACKERQDVAKATLRTISNELSEIVKDAKGLGITRDEIEISILLDTPEGEAKVRKEMQRTIEIAAWMNSSIGSQFEMFEDRRPAVDVARKQGYLDSQDDLPRAPKYDPSTEQYRAYMDGYNEHQTLLASGFRPPTNGHSDGVPAANESADGKPAGSVLRDKDGDAITSGTPVSRAEFREGLAANQAVVDEMIGTAPASFQVQ